MQLTRAADYAVRVMVTLANMPVGTRASHTELAAAVECPRPFLAKVLQRLTRAGLVVSYRGNVGGFELKKQCRSASLLQVVEAVEGPLALNICSGKKRCPRHGACPAHRCWVESQAAITRILGAARVDDLARQAREAEAEGRKWN